MAKNNKYTGETPLAMGGKNYTLVCDWEVIAEIRTAFKDANLDKVTRGMDPRDLSKVLEIMLKKHHPEITADAIMRLSPPMALVMEAVDRALMRAIYGADVLPKEETKGKKSRPPAPAAS